MGGGGPGPMGGGGIGGPIAKDFCFRCGNPGTCGNAAWKRLGGDSVFTRSLSLSLSLSCPEHRPFRAGLYGRCSKHLLSLRHRGPHFARLYVVRHLQEAWPLLSGTCTCCLLLDGASAYARTNGC